MIEQVRLTSSASLNVMNRLRKMPTDLSPIAQRATRGSLGEGGPTVIVQLHQMASHFFHSSSSQRPLKNEPMLSRSSLQAIKMGRSISLFCLENGPIKEFLALESLMLKRAENRFEFLGLK